MGLFNYADAMVNCQTQFGSNKTSKLFEPRDGSTNYQVIKFAKEMILPSAAWFFFGINDIGTEGTWQYVTGGNLVYTNWANGQPNDYGGSQDCGSIWPNKYASGVWPLGTWGDVECDIVLHSICEMI